MNNDINPYKSHEIDLLASYIDPDPQLCAQSLILEGPSCSGKTYSVTKYVNERHINHTLIQCDYCLTRHNVLKRVLDVVADKLRVRPMLASRGISINNFFNSRQLNHCENLSNFIYGLRHLLLYADKHKSANHVFILDRIDRMLYSEQPGELCAALSKLHEQDPQFSVFSFVFVVNRADYLNIPTMAIPLIEFSCYTTDEIKQIIGKQFVSDEWLDKVVKDASSHRINKMQLQRFVQSFIDYIVDTYGSYFGQNIDLMIPTLRKLWPIFYEPIKRRGSIKPHINDVLTTFMRNKKVLQTDTGLVERLDDNGGKNAYKLPLRTKYIIIASYLASFTDPKYDMLHYSKNREIRSNRKIRYGKRRKLGGGRTLGERLMSPQTFTLERMQAILKSIYMEFDKREEIHDDVEFMSEIATLESLKMLIKVGAHDTIGGGTKWRTNLEWNVVKRFAEDVGFDVESYMEE